jgi:hypothetical protein
MAWMKRRSGRKPRSYGGAETGTSKVAVLETILVLLDVLLFFTLAAIED